MVFEESDLLQDLLVLSASELGDDIVVSVYGSRDHVCGTVRFTFADAGERARALLVLRRWGDRDTTVSLLSHGDEMTLFSERAVLDRARSGAA